VANRPKPRVSLARNLRVLMESSALNGPEIARRAGVDIKTVNNMVNGRYDPRPEKVDQVAAVFGLSGWQLLIPDLPGDMLRNHGLPDLISNYVSANPDGRDNILRVAEMAARYKKG
jgi:transcriptional regulator with XRE-family HTH domain